MSLFDCQINKKQGKKIQRKNWELNSSPSDYTLDAFNNCAVTHPFIGLCDGALYIGLGIQGRNLQIREANCDSKKASCVRTMDWAVR